MVAVLPTPDAVRFPMTQVSDAVLCPAPMHVAPPTTFADWTNTGSEKLMYAFACVTAVPALLTAKVIVRGAPIAWATVGISGAPSLTAISVELFWLVTVSMKADVIGPLG